MRGMQDKTIRDIKELKLQGAEPIAVASANLMRDAARKSKKGLYRELIKTRDLLLKTRATEPCMFNTLNYILRDLKQYTDNELKELVEVRVNEVMVYFKEAGIKISKFGARKIAKNSIIFTHCHSSTVMGVFKEAKEDGKNFAVHNTETRPMMQGRKTALELARLNIPVTLYVDAAARLALKDADLMLIGCDAITAEGKVINKIGSEMFAEIAERLQIPVYVCSSSLKFDARSVFGYELPIETRPEKEVWGISSNNLKIDNHAFEKVDPKLITGIISEFGIYPPKTFIEIVKENHPWMFSL